MQSKVVSGERRRGKKRVCRRQGNEAARCASVVSRLEHGDDGTRDRGVEGPKQLEIEQREEVEEEEEEEEDVDDVDVDVDARA